MRAFRAVSTRTSRCLALCLVLAAFLPSVAVGGTGARKYNGYIRSAADRHGLDEKLIHSIIEAESNYNPSAVSSKGAVGLMQLIPETASRYGVADIFDPEQNIDAGVRYLKDLFSLYQSDLRSVLAAYNAGPEAVKKHNGIPPYPETERYVRKVLRLYNGLGGETSGQVYAFRDDRGKVLLTSDRFYLSMRRETAPER